METKRTDKTPKFQQMADELRARIDSGALAPGDRLPTETDMAEEYDTTRTTVRAALKVLIEEGAVEKLGIPPTAGYFVREITPRVWVLADQNGYVDPWQHITADDPGRGREMVSMRVEHGHAPLRATTLADLLHLSDDALVACRSATRYLDGVPVDLTDVYAPYEAVKDGPFMTGATGADIYALCSPDGRPSAFSDLLIARRNPLPSESARLELPEATGVVELVRILYFGRPDPGLLVHSVYSGAGAEFSSTRA